jgi:hypothetical protein
MEKKHKGTDQDKLRYAEAKAAGGEIAYRAHRALQKEDALSKLPAEEAGLMQKKRKKADQDKLRHA